MNRLKKFIEGLERPNFPFKPQRAFYDTVGIGQKRFWQIMRNDKQPTFDEAESLANYFGIQAKDLLHENQETK